MKALLHSAFTFAVLSLGLAQAAHATWDADKIRKFENYYASDILDDKEADAVVKGALTSVFVGSTVDSVRTAVMDDLYKSLEVATPATLVDGRFIVSTGCQAHYCDINRAMMVFDIQNPNAVMIVRKNQELTVDETREARAFLTNGEWTLRNGSDVSKLSQALQDAINAL